MMTELLECPERGWRTGVGGVHPESRAVNPVLAEASFCPLCPELLSPYPGPQGWEDREDGLTV